MTRARRHLPFLGIACGLIAGLEAQAQPDLNNGRFVAVGGYLNGAAGGSAGACFQCHGLDGAGDPTGAFPRLSGQSAWYLYDSMKDYASGARQNAIMTPIAQALSDRQMEDVAAYYAAQEDVPFPPPPDVDPLMLQHGAAISAVGIAQQGVQGCVNCHGPAGIGIPPSYPSLAGQYASYLELQLRLWKDGRRGGDPLNVMENIARLMTDEDIEAVSKYFASVRLPQAGQGADGTAGGPTQGTQAPQLGVVPSAGQ